MNTDAEIKEAAILWYIIAAEEGLQKIREQVNATEAELLKLRQLLMDGCLK